MNGGGGSFAAIEAVGPAVGKGGENDGGAWVAISDADVGCVEAAEPLAVDSLPGGEMVAAVLAETWRASAEAVLEVGLCVAGLVGGGGGSRVGRSATAGELDNVGVVCAKAGFADCSLEIAYSRSMSLTSRVITRSSSPTVSCARKL